MMSQPAVIAAFAVSDLNVSTESGISNLLLIASNAGMSLSSSSSAEIGTELGPVASAPRSIQSAPSRIISEHLSTAASTSLYLPPSEKESGVRLRIPIMSVFLPISSWRLPHL